MTCPPPLLPATEQAPSAPPEFAHRHLVAALKDFIAMNPRLSIRFDLADERIDLIERRIDLAIRIGELHDSRLVARKIGWFEELICAAPACLQRTGHPDSPEELSEREWVLFAPLGEPASLTLHHHREGTRQFRVNGRLITNQSESLLSRWPAMASPACCAPTPRTIWIGGGWSTCSRTGTSPGLAPTPSRCAGMPSRRKSHAASSILPPISSVPDCRNRLNAANDRPPRSCPGRRRVSLQAAAIRPMDDSAALHAYSRKVSCRPQLQHHRQPATARFRAMAGAAL